MRLLIEGGYYLRAALNNDFTVFTLRVCDKMREMTEALVLCTFNKIRLNTNSV